MFTLHPQLQQDCIELGHFDLCTVLLMNDANYPWLILVPRRENITEIFQLKTTDQQLLHEESILLSRALHKTFKADKLNIAALGNIVPQLHVHHIVRYRKDIAWPAPAWGNSPAQPYAELKRQEMITTVRQMLGSQLKRV